MGWEVSIADSVKTIKDNAFKSCSNLSKLTLPKGIEELEQYAFSACGTRHMEEAGHTYYTIDTVYINGCNWSGMGWYHGSDASYHITWSGIRRG